MNPITHCLSSWLLANQAEPDRRGRVAVAFAGVLPDLDGLGIVPDLLSRHFGAARTDYYGTYHHFLLHGLPAAIALPLLLSVAARRRLKTICLGFVAVHAHLLLDLVGSRGPEPSDLWPIRYLAPFSERVTFSVAWQWPLNGWPNFLFTIVLLALAFRSAIANGRTPLELAGRNADGTLVAAVRDRWERIRRR